MDEERVMGASTEESEGEKEASVRPLSLDEYIGQEKTKENLRTFIQAAKGRGGALDHLLFHGPPGLGKTTLATIIARELGVSIRTTSGPVLEKAGDLAALLSSLQENDILFIDEIHRLKSNVEEVLYPAMEDFQMDMIIGQGIGAKSIKIDIPHFTLIGATTRAGMLTSPLRDRFGILCHLDYYTNEELAIIVKRSASIFSISIEEDGAKELACRSRGTPRIANRLLRRVRDFADVKGCKSIDRPLTDHALTMLEVDSSGLEKMDRMILEALIQKFDGGPVGIENLAISVGEAKDVIEDMYEPYLIQRGLMQRTPRGRVATAGAYQHLGIHPGTTSLPQGENTLFSD